MLPGSSAFHPQPLPSPAVWTIIHLLAVTPSPSAPPGSTLEAGDIPTALGVVVAIVVGAGTIATAIASWKAADKSAQAAATLTRIEMDRTHRELEPQVDGKWALGEDGALVFQFRIAGSNAYRNYKIRGVLSDGHDRSPTRQADGSYLATLHSWQPAETYRWHSLVFLFWPPPAEDADAWTCPCDKADDISTNVPHWRYVVMTFPSSPDGLPRITRG